MQTILRILDAGMQTPQMYGWFHLLSLGLMFAAIASAHKWKKSPDQVNKVLLIVSVTTLLLEVYKQINFNFAYDGDLGVRLEPQLYAFPWQFCSTPMYVGLLAGLLRRGRVYQALCAYLATYALFAGACVMLYPVTVFTGTIGINIQTMFCHGSAVVVGVYLFMSGHVKPAFGTLLKAFPVFCAAVAIAVLLNETAYLLDVLEEHNFNMFFISRHCEPELPIYSQVQKKLPYPVCLLVYLFGFTAAAGGVLAAANGTARWSARRKRKRTAAMD